MKITERRIVVQEYYQDDEGIWEGMGWEFKDSEKLIPDDWSVVDVLDEDKFYNPILGIAERTIEI